MSKTHIPLAPLFLTEEKIAHIKKELRKIDKKILPDIRKRLSAAYEDGDMPENNPWLTANDDLQEAMRRKNELRLLLARTKHFTQAKKRNTLQLGSNVTISLNNKAPQKILLVSSEEADPPRGKYSISSPIGNALLGKSLGETITVQTPAGSVSITILKE